MEFEELKRSEGCYFGIYNADEFNKKIVDTKIGKLYLYRTAGWNAKKFESGKELYQMETIVYREGVLSFAYWLNNILF